MSATFSQVNGGKNAKCVQRRVRRMTTSSSSSLWSAENRHKHKAWWTNLITSAATHTQTEMLQSPTSTSESHTHTFAQWLKTEAIWCSKESRGKRRPHRCWCKPWDLLFVSAFPPSALYFLCAHTHSPFFASKLIFLPLLAISQLNGTLKPN